MNTKSLFKIFDDFTSKQLSKINAILDPKQTDLSPALKKEGQPGLDLANRKKRNPGGFAVGLDIGSSKITVVVGKLAANDLIEVIGTGEANCDGLIRGSISNINKVSAAIKLALSVASAQANVNIQEVYASYSGAITNHVEHGVLLRDDLASEINENDIFNLRQEMHNAVLPAGEKLIYLQAKPYTIDSEPGILDPIGMAGRRIEADFQLVTANSVPIEYLYKCCAQSNVVLKDVVPASVATAEAVLCHEEMEEGVAVIDIGAAVTSIAIYNKGNLIRTENFPLGGNNISMDIRDFTGLQLRQAELLKKQFGNVKPDGIPLNEFIEVKILNGTKFKQVFRKELCEVIKSRVEELISIAFSIVTDALKRDKLKFGIVFTGGASSLPYFKELAHEITGAQCHLGNTSLHLAEQPLKTELSGDIRNRPDYATAIGLVKIGLLDH
ncbi:MAG: ftsA [Pedobacter sp.]|jgi:cell division protein FtsA|nr:ftsA [Pedobacter sp.]